MGLLVRQPVDFMIIFWAPLQVLGEVRTMSWGAAAVIWAVLVVAIGFPFNRYVGVSACSVGVKVLANVGVAAIAFALVALGWRGLSPSTYPFKNNKLRK